MSAKMLRPRNGWLVCAGCNDEARPGDDGIQVGDVCRACEVDMYQSDKRTVVGPLSPVPTTGNPLLDAAAILEVDGWVRGEYACAEGKKCLAGAVRAACGLYADPALEERDLAYAMTQTTSYREATRRTERALFALAVRIEDKCQVPADKRRATAGDYNAEECLGVVTSYNDVVIMRNRPEDALRILREAAPNFNPRLKLPAS